MGCEAGRWRKELLHCKLLRALLVPKVSVGKDLLKNMLYISVVKKTQTLILRPRTAVAGPRPDEIRSKTTNYRLLSTVGDVRLSK